MAPTIYLVRHAQGIHNLGVEYYGIRDPRLTTLGQEQCQRLRGETRDELSGVSLIFASPLSRTIETALVAFQPLLSNGQCYPQIIAISDAQETSDAPCDTGLEPTELEAECSRRDWPVDVSLVQHGWTRKIFETEHSPAWSAIEVRAKRLRSFLRDKVRDLISRGNPDPELVLVSHGQFLHFLTQDWENFDRFVGTSWSNCEWRSYHFEAGLNEENQDSKLIETTKSRLKRGLNHAPLNEGLQKSLCLQAPKRWLEQGAFSPV